jgi:transcriptional regulator with XRE-family HTH domain
LTPLPQILRSRRKALKLEPEDIAKRLGKSTRTYLYYEDGVNPKNPKPETLKKLAEILQFNISEVYNDATLLQIEGGKKDEEEPKNVLPARQDEMEGMFLMLIEHLKSIGSNLNLTKDVAQQNNSLLQTVLLKMAEEKAETAPEAGKLFEGSLEVAKAFLNRNFARTESDKFEHVGS